MAESVALGATLVHDLRAVERVLRFNFLSAGSRREGRCPGRFLVECAQDRRDARGGGVHHLGRQPAELGRQVAETADQHRALAMVQRVAFRPRRSGRACAVQIQMTGRGPPRRPPARAPAAQGHRHSAPRGLRAVQRRARESNPILALQRHQGLVGRRAPCRTRRMMTVSPAMRYRMM